MLIKIIGIAFISLFVSLLLKKEKPEIALLVTVAGGVMIMLLVLSSVGEIFQLFTDISLTSQMSSNLIKPIIKVVAIGYLTEFSSNVAEESGSKILSSKIIFGGKIIVLLVCLPLIKTMFELLLDLL